MPLREIEKIMTDAVNLRTNITNAQNLQSILAELDKTNPFTLTDSNPFDIVPAKQKGLYFIEIKFPFTNKKDLEDFGNKWGKERANKLTADCPRFYKNRVTKSNSDKLAKSEFVPFYLGKSEDVQKRLKEHFEDTIGSGTYALKLQDRNAQDCIFDNCEFRFSWIIFSTPPVESYFCVGILETAIRNKLDPLVGRQ